MLFDFAGDLALTEQVPSPAPLNLDQEDLSAIETSPRSTRNTPLALPSPAPKRRRRRGPPRCTPCAIAKKGKYTVCISLWSPLTVSAKLTLMTPMDHAWTVN
jgi:hypothetical protein